MTTKVRILRTRSPGLVVECGSALLDPGGVPVLYRIHRPNDEPMVVDFSSPGARSMVELAARTTACPSLREALSAILTDRDCPRWAEA